LKCRLVKAVSCYCVVRQNTSDQSVKLQCNFYEQPGAQLKTFTDLSQIKTV